MKNLLLSILLISSTIFGSDNTSPKENAANPAIPNVVLTNQEGKPLPFHSYKGSSVFVSFVYTRCPMPKMCPLTMSLNRRLFNQWKKTASEIPLKFLIVTLDPEFDTPGVLKKFGERHKLDFKYFALATGSDKLISDFASLFNSLGFPSAGMISHNAKSILIGPDSVPLKEFKENEWTPEEVLKVLKSSSTKS